MASLRPHWVLPVLLPISSVPLPDTSYWGKGTPGPSRETQFGLPVPFDSPHLGQLSANVAREARADPLPGTGSPARRRARSNATETQLPFSAAAQLLVGITLWTWDERRPSLWGSPALYEAPFFFLTLSLTSSIKGWLSAKGLKGINKKSAGPFFSSLFSRRLLPPCGRSHRRSISRFSKAHL